MAGVFLITGAAGSIGSATAKAAKEAGWDVVVSGRSQERLDALATELGGPPAVLPVRADVTEWDDLCRLAETIRHRYGRLDAAFANAGISTHDSFLAAADPHEDWRSMVLTNVYGAAITARAMLPLLAEARGHLLLTGSVAGRVPVPGSLYSATKWALTAMGHSIRAEVVGTGIRVTVIQPGLVDSPHIAEHRRDEPKLDPADVARAVMYAVEQPPGVDVNEIVVRPLGQSRYR